MSGIVERVRTREKARFQEVDAIGDAIARMIGGDVERAFGHEPGPDGN